MRPWPRRIARAVGVLLLAGAATVATASAASAESIRDFAVEVQVYPDTTFRVVESITYDFEGAYRHGIFRDIPVYDETFTGARRTYGVEVESVSMDGGAVPWELTENGPFLNVKIGDPFTTITGPHTYVITYTVRDGLRALTPDDVADPQAPAGLTAGDVELYWDFVGTGWQVPIASARATVLGPGTVLAARCLDGPAGATTECPAVAAKSVAGLGPVGLGPGEALTGSIVWPAASFARPPSERVTQGLPSNPLVGVLGGLIPAALLVGLPVGLAVSRRREDAGAPVPGAPPQYAPPDGLRPAELYAAWQGRKGTTEERVVLATLLDLAARRWIDLSDTGGSLQVDWVGMGSPAMAPWEEDLIRVVLKGQTTATLSGYDKELAVRWGLDYRELVDRQEAVGRRNPKGDEPDRRWSALAVVAAVFIAAGFVAMFAGQAFIAAVGLTVGLGALAGFVAARIITPRRQTEQSARFLAEVDGFRAVLGTDAAAGRREFAQRSGLAPAAIFATMLPFAVVFDLEDAWLGAFPDLTPDQLASTGFHVGGIAAMDGLISSGTSSMSSAMTAPSSGSGGGGSSGGGGGGGGGGSW